MNNKGAEKVLSVYWFAILIIVAGGVFAMIYNFYNHPYDVRELESNFLVNTVADCVSVGGKMSPYVFEDDFKENFMDYCSLNFKTEGDWESPQYYVGLEIQDETGPVVSLDEGNLNLISGCDDERDVEEKNVAKCVEREFVSLDDSGNLYAIKIKGIVRKTEKNVRT